jgi:2-polyprenyl-3-methyl-5-hydroxy-6-metoxy-1,4-benzoquinol methylase
MREFLRNLWTRAILRGIHHRDRFSRFDHLYRIENPWHMDSDSEMFRFEETNRLIRMHFAAVDTLLEIGCGEGHQTAKLAELSNRIYAIDISGRAVERARQRCPNGIFSVGDIFSAPILGSAQRFDLVVACEVLYYTRNVSAVLARMEQLGRSCFVTYVSTQHTELDSPLKRIPGRQSTEFKHNNVCWHAVWWTVGQDRNQSKRDESGPSRGRP